MRRLGVVVFVVCSLAGAACSSTAEPPPGGKNKAQGARTSTNSHKEKTQRTSSPSPEPSSTPTLAEVPNPRPWWKLELDRVLRNKSMSVQVRFNGSAIYSHNANNERVPASTQKLVLSMALFEQFGPSKTFPTKLAVRSRRKNLIEGDLWVIGTGNPALAGNPVVLDQLPPGSVNIQQLVAALKRENITQISGNVMAATEPFARDWFAPGWKPFFPSSEVGLPTALTFNGNVYKQHYTKRPEQILAENLRRRLRRSGIEVAGGSGSGPLPRKLRPIATVPSPRLAVLARFMNRQSNNFFAEVLGKALGATVFSEPGTISKGARAIERFAHAAGVDIAAHDSSGLSYANQISPAELALLAELCQDEPWYISLRSGLATGGEGTLKERLHGVKMRAKTGTLDGVSTLGGWVWLNKAKDWAQFAIMSRGIDKTSAMKVEDRIVRILQRAAR